MDQFWLIIPYLVNFLIFAIFPYLFRVMSLYNNDFIFMPHYHLCHSMSLYFPYHHSFHVITTFVFPLNFTELTLPSCPWLFLLSSLGLCLDATKIFTCLFTLLVFVFYYALLLLECSLSLVSSSCFQCWFIYSLYNPAFSFIFVLYITFK